jgi:2-methylisocitrate lyase-like PEP mutase family enzyme
MHSLADKRREFRRLHETGCLVMPNPWDIGSARYLQSLNFKALATTSAGAAWSLGYADGAVPLDAMLAHMREIARASDVAVNADFGNGFAHDAKSVGNHVRMAIETGVAGLSIEDSTGEKGKPLYDIGHAVERVRAARNAIDHSATGVILTARAENFLVGHADLNDAMMRISAYAGAGADCLYVPGLRTREQIVAVVKAVAPKPVNVLMGFAGDLTVPDLALMGVRRISTGSAFARVAWAGVMRAARLISEAGRFDGFADLAPNAELNQFFHDDQLKRSKP